MTPETPQKELAAPEIIRPAADRIRALADEINQGLLGREELHRLVLAAVLCRGHVLLEGLPGTGKTMLIRRLGEAMNLEFHRIQFTPDLMPSDVLGVHILEDRENEGRRMVFHPGPVFCNILLADEINRASPKTQSALLEAMEERSVTLLGTTRKLPRPFFVLASQNPVELEGTYPLPEAQLDRFLFKLEVETPSVDVLRTIVSTRRRGELPPVRQQLSSRELEEIFDIMEMIFLPDAVASYIAQLVAATHPDQPAAPDGVKKYVEWGASPRAAIALAEASRAMALMDGRPSVGFDDVAAVASAALAHRIILSHRARLENASAADIISELLQDLDPLDLSLPGDITVNLR